MPNMLKNISILLFTLLCIVVTGCIPQYLQMHKDEKTAVKVEQLLLLTTPNDTSSQGFLRLYEFQHKHWEPVTDFVPVRIGRNGLAFLNSPYNNQKKIKFKENGDGKTPRGLFFIKQIFGYQDAPNENWKMPYFKIDKNSVCVNDAISVYYDKIINQSEKGSITNYENLSTDDNKYEFGIELDYRCDLCKVKAGTTSCLYMHLKTSESSTAGGVAIPKSFMLDLFNRLDINKNPMCAQVTMEDCEEFRTPYFPSFDDIDGPYTKQSPLKRKSNKPNK
jgi:L,D-peptidoglycan transpeptidase YkuD (ErfK/YbiS/YcfS/YnhG family)